MKKIVVVTSAALALCAIASGPAWGQANAAADYPSKTIRFVVPFTTGGPNDIFARMVGQKLSERWGQQVTVDNRAGANGMVGADNVAKSAPDGYTWLLANAGVFVLNPVLYSKLPYDAEKDFTPVNLMASASFLLVVQPELKVKSVAELVALARAQPKMLNFGSGGVGATAHLAGELLNFMTGINTVHIAYKGAAPALTDLLGGRLAFTFTSPAEAMSFIKQGKLVPIGITSPKRSAALPDIPAIAETVPGYEVRPWYGVAVPAKTPRAIVDKMNREITAVIQRPDITQQFNAGGADVVGLPPDEFAKTITRELAMWSKLAKEANIKLEQ